MNDEVNALAQKHRKTRKKLGQRTQGKGSHKKNRGAGNRGGRGKAGRLKGKYTWVAKNRPRYFGRYGFLPPTLGHVYPSINVGELEEIAGELVERGLAKEGKKGIEIDANAMGYEKVLGKGRVSRALVVKAKRFSRRAEEKLEKAKGKAVVME